MSDIRGATKRDSGDLPRSATAVRERLSGKPPGGQAASRLLAQWVHPLRPYFSFFVIAAGGGALAGGITPFMRAYTAICP